MCGIFGIANHPDASNMTHLGLYALQHRGQESTGISSSDGHQVFTHKAMGYVAEVFSEDVLKRLKGINASSLREGLEQEGAIFQSTSDSEVILHLLARSEAENLLDALCEVLSRVQ